MRAIKPPKKGFEEFILYREAYSEDVEIFIGEHIYILPWEETEQWLRALVPRKHDLFVQKTLNYLYNMRCLKFFVKQLRFIPFKKEKEDEYRFS